MSGSFGAGFLTLALLAVLAGLAGLLGLIAVGAAASRRRTGRVPSLARSLAVAVQVAVVLSAGIGVLALADEAAVGTGRALTALVRLARWAGPGI